MSAPALVAAGPRPVPVIVLADVSGSMAEGGKIDALNGAIEEMAQSFATEDDRRGEIHLAVIAFGGEQAHVAQALVPARDVGQLGLVAAGRTPLADALTLALELIEDDDQLPARANRPMLVLISDGLPDDDWASAMGELRASDRASRALRVAVAIGGDADREMLTMFLDDPAGLVLDAQSVGELRQQLRLVTMSVSRAVDAGTYEAAATLDVFPGMASMPATSDRRGDEDRMRELRVPERVVDEAGMVWPVNDRLGGGGQGAVFVAEGHQKAIKLLRRTTPAKRRLVADQIAYVSQLDLRGLPISAPLHPLRWPNTGYVMDLADRMRPLDDLRAAPRSRDPWDWYRETGGLARRLRMLARLADVLHRLHEKDLVYGDLSCNNVMVSEDPALDLIRVIDADNLRDRGEPDDTVTAGRYFYTPIYGAPEIHRGEARVLSDLTDAHALAVVVYHVLAARHPLLDGKRVDLRAALEEAALRGEIPWVDHPGDPSNRPVRGIDHTWVLTPLLLDLACRTFGPGLHDPSARPSAAEWTEALRLAADMCLSCPRCDQSFLASAEHGCPWCPR